MSCAFRPARIPAQGVSRHSEPDRARCSCPVGTRSASPSKGWRLAARACCHTPAPPEPQARGQAVRTDKEGHSCFPALPTPYRSSCLGPCWNVTGVMARASPNSRSARLSPPGFPQPPALFRWMAAGRLFMPRRPPEVAASTGPCGGCCPLLPPSSLQELLARGSGGAVGCGEPRADSPDGGTERAADRQTQIEEPSPPRMTSAAPAKKPYRKAPPEHRELRLEVPGPQLEQEDSLTDAERMKLLQQENEELRRRLALATRRTEALERELEIGQDCLELELGQSREELDKFKDKFRRLQNSYTASQRTNQELEDKLHTLIKKAEVDRKTLDWEIVELTNKLLDARNTINKLEELNERYRLDCNLAVQLLKCNKSHFRNHKLADLPCELQDMVQKHLHSGQEAARPGPAPSLAPGAVVPTSVIARVLEKPESLLLNSAQSGSAGRPLAEDVFVHVDMSVASGDPASPPVPGSPTPQANGECHSLSTAGGSPEDELPLPAFEKLSPYPTPSPPHPLYPGRKVIEFSEDKVRIPRNSPLPNCTYATRQAISLSLVEEGSERARPTPAPSCPASAPASPHHQPSPAPLTFSAPAGSEEDLLASWQRVFVDRTPPLAAVAQRTAFGHDALPELQRHFALSPSDGEEGVLAPGESGLLLPTEPGAGLPREEEEEELNLPVSPEEEQQSLLPSDSDTEKGPGTPHAEGRTWALPGSGRPQRSPKRMGVHHLHRKDSLTQAQEQGNLLN
ncbi:tight junction-associated protein 1 isoform X3 [Saccopteryx bilineata]|uniref:tight junction-associated protein 1 isoform X3 n=1 Tax=Saccopteryx bilineata TaxID=59482 RepID=UPI00338D7E8F